MMRYVIGIDQGTTNSRAIIFDEKGVLKGKSDAGLSQKFPHDGWVEQDPAEMFRLTVKCCRDAIKNARVEVHEIAGIGISNQRETTIIWDKKTGEAIYPAIVWQDRRTAEECARLKSSSLEKEIKEKTGLLLDPYFSATKIAWILDHVPNARKKAEKGELLFGTVDTYLLWRFTNGQSHFTDITNASRTLLFNIHTLQWDDGLLAAFNIPKSLLPEVKPTVFQFGGTAVSLFGKAIPILGMAGDQQAATIGQACFNIGMVKVTFGTGGFMLMNTGNDVIQSQHQLIATVAYQIKDSLAYGLEGSIFSAGVTIKWLRDQLTLFRDVSEVESLAASVPDNGNVYLVPAFTGLGAPHWQPNARAAISGLTSNTQKAHIVRAGLEGVVYQTRDLLDAMLKDSRLRVDTIRVDGGMVKNNWLLQFLADMLQIKVQRPKYIETSALGAGYLAWLALGVFPDLATVASYWQLDREFVPIMDKTESERLYAAWQKALQPVLSS